MMDSQLSSQMCLLNISSSAMRWLLTRNSDNSVDLDNVDQSVAFRAKRGDVFVGGAMLIVPQFENDRFVLGSIYGEVTPDLSGPFTTATASSRRFAVDLYTGEMQQMVWFDEGRVTLMRHAPKVGEDWFNEVFVFESPNRPDEVPCRILSKGIVRSFRDCSFCLARETPCECCDTFRRRALPSKKSLRCYSWADWAKQFIISSRGAFRTTIDFSPLAAGGKQFHAQVWWQFTSDMGSDYGTQMLRTAYVESTGRGYPNIGFGSDPETSLSLEACREATHSKVTEEDDLQRDDDPMTVGDDSMFFIRQTVSRKRPRILERLPNNKKVFSPVTDVINYIDGNPTTASDSNVDEEDDMGSPLFYNDPSSFERRRRTADSPLIASTGSPYWNLLHNYSF